MKVLSEKRLSDYMAEQIADEILARNHSHRAEVIKLDKIKADVQQALFMQTKEGEPLFHSIIIFREFLFSCSSIRNWKLQNTDAIRLVYPSLR